MTSPELDQSLASKILDTMGEALYVVDTQRRIVVWNQAAEALTGFSAAEVLGRRCGDRLLNHIDEDGEVLCGERCPLQATIDDGQTRDVNVYLLHRDGYRRPVAVRATALDDGQGERCGAAETFHDNAQMHATSRRLAEVEAQALTDPLTGLGNRRYLESELVGWLSDRERYGYGFGVLMIDVDFFKRVNDTFGHDIGDRVLKMVASSLVYGARAGDVVARWGGEEFCVLVRTPTDKGLSRAAERLRALVQNSRLDTPAGPVRVTISVGGAFCESPEAADRLLTDADEALYRAKHSGRNRVVVGEGAAGEPPVPAEGATA
jgi:diguanylate cyclase (GGDEF)-like protein/PAS domain S-box-containing protein